jgi:hypothetical protein
MSGSPHQPDHEEPASFTEQQSAGVGSRIFDALMAFDIVWSVVIPAIFGLGAVLVGIVALDFMWVLLGIASLVLAFLVWCFIKGVWHATRK